jgi:hypothetical protein
MKRTLRFALISMLLCASAHAQDIRSQWRHVRSLQRSLGNESLDSARERSCVFAQACKPRFSAAQQ